MKQSTETAIHWTTIYIAFVLCVEMISNMTRGTPPFFYWYAWDMALVYIALCVILLIRDLCACEGPLSEEIFGWMDQKDPFMEENKVPLLA